MFKRIAIDNFRCLSNFEFEPGRVNLLLGANGSGKSSLFDAIDAVVDLVTHAADTTETFPGTSLTRWDTRSAQRIELDVELAGDSYHYEVVVRHDDDRERSWIDHERVTRAGKTLFAFEDQQVRLHRNDGSRGVSFGFRGNRSFLSLIEDREETRDLKVFLQFLNKVWSIRLDARNIDNSSMGEDESLDRDGTNFASWYRHITQEAPDRLEPLWSSIRPVVSGFQSLKLMSSGRRGRARDLAAVMKMADASYDVDFGELSDGERALIVLYALIHGTTPAHGCLMLDEPEAHVGLAEVQPWLVELCEAFESRGQIFVVSHHPEVVNYMAASQAFMFERPDNGPVRVRPATFERESGLYPAEQISRGLVIDGQA